MQNKTLGSAHKHLVSLLQLIDSQFRHRFEDDDAFFELEDQLALDEYRRRRIRSIEMARKLRTREFDSAA